MINLTTAEEAKKYSEKLHGENSRIALIPTLGCLHEGHKKQIEEARGRADSVVVSIFVDPEEFGPNEDYHQYPRVPEQDREFCEQNGVAAVFQPRDKVIYPDQGHSTYVIEKEVSSGLCGVSRSHHFRGVATTFLKLYHLFYPEVVVLGKDHIQRFGVIRRVARDLFLPAEIVGTPLVREPDGLVCDARNQYLNNRQREEACQVYKALLGGKEIYEQGNTSVDRITAEVINRLREYRRLHVLYVQLVDRENLNPVREIKPGETLLCVGVLIDQVRMVDHVEL